MGTYYAAVDEYEKTYFESPRDNAITSPGIFHPHNAFGCMLVMMNSKGHQFKIHNDAEAYYETYCSYKNITEEVYKEFLEEYPWAEKYYETESEKKEIFMLDKLASLFPEQPMQNVSQVLASVSNFISFLEQKFQGDAAKVNEAIDHIKDLFDSHKK
jgi:hypothetical protein